MKPEVRERREARQKRLAARAARAEQKAQAAAIEPGASNSAPLPLPPPPLAGRVAGTDNMDWFDKSGELTLGDWRRALAAAGKSFNQFSTIVDFGCGCGRVLRHLRPATNPAQRIIGIDVDAEAIGWVAANIGGVEAYALDLLPPSPLADESVDLIVNQSVFTHLPEEVQFAWLGDLQRVLRPGGTAVLTFHGRKVWAEYRAHLGDNERTELDERFERNGFHYVQGRGTFEQALPEYYGSTFHTIAYVEREWQRYLKLKAWLPVASLVHQDIVVLEKT